MFYPYKCISVRQMEMDEIMKERKPKNYLARPNSADDPNNHWMNCYWNFSSQNYWSGTAIYGKALNMASCFWAAR